MSTDVRISFEPKSAPLSKAAIPETPPLGRGRCSQGLSVGASVRPSVFSTRIPTSFICRSRDPVWLDSESLYVTCRDVYTCI